MLTKLEAVNIILDSIGETPVSSLTSGLPDAEAAEAKLNETHLEVLSKGWHQNTERGITLTPNHDKEILIPRNYLRIDSFGRDASKNVVVRMQNGKRKLYNLDTYSYTFEAPLECIGIIELTYDSLVFELQNYIAHRAARKFQESSMGSTSLDGFTVRQEQESYVALLDSEAESDDSNILRDSAHAAWITGRYHPLSGR